MADWVHQLICSYAPRGLLIDTNVLLLYFVGFFDQRLIEKFKRTQSRGYTKEDFVLVVRLVSRFAHIITTPHILAELSNLSLQMPKSHLAAYFKGVVSALRAVREEHVCKDAILSSPRVGLLHKIGITDLSMIEAAKKLKCLVLTDDFKAAGYLKACQCGVINLNHIRGMSWLAG